MQSSKPSNRILRSFRFTTVADLRLRERAGKAKMNDTEYLHHLILNVYDSEGNYHRELCNLQREINAIGRNINQIVKSHNQNFFSNTDKIHLENEVVQIRTLLHDLIENIQSRL